MISSRRNFLIGATASLVTAPAIVRAASLMPVKSSTWPVMRTRIELGIVYGRSPAMEALCNDHAIPYAIDNLIARDGAVFRCVLAS